MNSKVLEVVLILSIFALSIFVGLSLFTKSEDSIMSPIVVVEGAQTDVSQQHWGTGFIVNGYVITAAHVVRGMTDVRIRFNDNIVLPGTVVSRGSYKAVDIAVIAITKSPWDKENQINKYTSLTFSCSPVKYGDPISILGHPAGFFFSYLKGEIMLPKVIEKGINYIGIAGVDGAPGLSGSPILNEYWQVIGVLTRSGSFSASYPGQGVGGVLWAISIHELLGACPVEKK